MPLPDDAALNARLTLLRRTDPPAFIELLFKSFYAPLGAVVYRVVPDRNVVEDLAQDVFLKVWQDRAALPEITSYRAYLTRMALNAALRYRERDQRQVPWDAAPPTATAPVAPDALNQLHAAETAGAVAAALTKLPPQCRVVFELSRYDDLSYQQIAEALDIAPKTVENQMGKALRILRHELAGVLRNRYGLLLGLLTAQGMGGLPTAQLAPPQVGIRTEFFQDPRGGGAPIGYLPGEAAPAFVF